MAKGRDLIIGGDFNLTISSRHSFEKPESKAVTAIQRRLRDELGLMNCWKYCNPDVPLAQTLRWTGDRTVNYHCDGIFVPRSWRDRLLSAGVLSGPQWDALNVTTRWWRSWRDLT